MVADICEPAEPTLDRLRGQDVGAFEWLVERSQRIVLGLGQSLGLVGPDLDDAAAEVYLAVYQALPKFEGRSAITTWVYQIACRTLTRARTRLRLQRGAPLSDRHADPHAPRPDVAQDLQERKESIWAAVATLEPRSAMAVELHYRREMPLDEVAAVLGCPLGTVKTLLFRARETLKFRLAALENER